MKNVILVGMPGSGKSTLGILLAKKIHYGYIDSDSVIVAGAGKLLPDLIAEIAEEHPEWKVCKVNVDEEGTLAARFGINSIPTVLLIKGGRTVATSVGYLPKEDLLKALGLE